MGVTLTHNEKTNLRPINPFTEGVHAPLPMVARSRRVLRSMKYGRNSCLSPVRALASIEPCLMTELLLAARFYEPNAVIDTLEDALCICSHHKFSEMLLSSDNTFYLAQRLPGETHQWLISNFTSCIARELVTLLAPASIAPTVAAEAGLLHNVIYYLRLCDRVDNVQTLDCREAVALLPQHIAAVAKDLAHPQSTEPQHWNDLIYIVTLAREMARFGHRLSPLVAQCP